MMALRLTLKLALKLTLAGLGVAAFLLVLIFALPLPIAPLPDESVEQTLNKPLNKTIAIQNINIVDVTTGELIENATVIIEQSRITSITTSSTTSSTTSNTTAAHPSLKPSTTIIDGSGKFLVPGLWDMHTHGLKLSPQLHHPLFIRYGVTSARDMSGCMSKEDSYWACPQDRLHWEAQSTAGQAVSPRYPLQSSYQTNGGNEVPSGFPDFFRLNALEDARTLTRFYADQEVDFIKTYTELSQHQFTELSLAAAENGIALAGHKPLKVPLTDALTAPMTSIEHGRLFMFECYGAIDALRSTDNPLALYNAEKIRQIIDHQDSQKCVSAMQAMAATSTYWVPTLTTLKMSAMSRNDSFRTDARLIQIPYIIKALLWEPDINRAARLGVDANGQFVHADYFDAVSQQINAANRAGVKLLVGTDNIDTYVFTGSSVHDELEMLVQAGLSPIEALRAATIHAAEFANKEGDLGSVSVGKKADLVIINHNPLTDINNIRSIDGVIFNGHYFDDKALQGLERFTIEMAQNIRINLHYLASLLMSPLMRVQLAD